MVVSGCGELGVTRPPTGTSVSPIRPPIGARMVPYSRFSSAVRTAAFCDSTLACIESICVRVESVACSTLAL